MTSIRNPRFKQLNPLDVAMEWVLHYESGGDMENGGYISPEEAVRRGDRGGETKWGIAKKYHQHRDIKNLTKEEAAKILHEEYWKPIKADALPPATALLAFDLSVNSGASRAVKALRKVAGLPEDGPLNRRVFRNIQKLGDKEAARALVQYRADWVAAISAAQPHNAKGWSNRLKQVAELAGKVAHQGLHAVVRPEHVISKQKFDLPGGPPR